MYHDYCDYNHPFIVGHPHVPGIENTIVNSGEDIVWDNSRDMKGNLIVRSGGKLTIKCEVRFPGERGRIHVDPGGWLVVDGGTLTSSCAGRNWSGVKVYGNPNQNQNELSNGAPLYQGKLELINGATIEKAYVGVQACGYDYPAPPAPSDPYPTGLNTQGGGIIFAENANFVDNLTSIEFGPYFIGFTPWDNRSYVKDCHFEYGTPDHDRADPIEFILMRGSRGIEVDGNTFVNLNTSKGPGEKGYGIHLIDGEARIGGVGNPNIFQNLSDGVYASASSNAPYTAPDIIDNVFDGVERGVTVQGGANSDVRDCEFKNIPQGTSAVSTYGVYVGAKRAQISGNAIKAAQSPTGVSHSTGIVVKGSGNNTVAVSENNIRGMAFSFHGIGHNPNVHTSCNYFDDYATAFVVSRVATGDGFADQGTNCNDRPDNVFRLSCLPPIVYPNYQAISSQISFSYYATDDDPALNCVSNIVVHNGCPGAQPDCSGGVVGGKPGSSGKENPTDEFFDLFGTGQWQAARTSLEALPTTTPREQSFRDFYMLLLDEREGYRPADAQYLNALRDYVAADDQTGTWARAEITRVTRLPVRPRLNYEVARGETTVANQTPAEAITASGAEISYLLTADQVATVRVFALDGRRVTTHRTAADRPSRYAYTFDPRAHGYAPGVYVAVVEVAGQPPQVLKLVTLR